MNTDSVVREQLRTLLTGGNAHMTFEEAVANLKEATELYLEEFSLSDVGRPILTTFEATNA